jgi:hypothetical protein
MSWRLPSYKPADCCPNTHCHSGYDSSRPCWGQTTVVGEDYTDDDHWWTHACEGHAGYCDGFPYQPSNRPEDQGVQPTEDDE